MTDKNLGIKRDQQTALNTRRDFLKGVGAGAGVLALGGSGAVSAAGDGDKDRPCKTLGCDYDVVVVGGGNAGAAAARDSMKNGYRTLLLEAKNRLGGRTLSTDFEGTPVELGGFWIHHTQPYVWAEKERYGLDIIETPGAVPDVIAMSIDGKYTELTLEQVNEAIGGWQSFTDPGREILPRNWDILHNSQAALEADKISAAEQIEKMKSTPLQKNFNRSLVAALAHNTPEAISYLEVLRWHQCGGGYFPTFMDAVARFSLKDGTESLVNKMIEDGGPEVRLSTPVASVEDKGEYVVVTTARGEMITAGAVIACLPMNTIANVRFDPALPDGVVEAGKERHTGQGVKLYLKVKGDIGNILSVSDSASLNYIMTYKQAKEYTMLVAFGGDSEALDVYDDEAVQAVLQELIPGAELISSMSYDWNSDPYARGTYASYKPGWVAKYYDQFQKDTGRILFGSSDHGEGWRGFIDGAIGGGILAAHRAKKILGKL